MRRSLPLKVVLAGLILMLGALSYGSVNIGRQVQFYLFWSGALINCFGVLGFATSILLRRRLVPAPVLAFLVIFTPATLGGLLYAAALWESGIKDIKSPGHPIADVLVGVISVCVGILGGTYAARLTCRRSARKIGKWSAETLTPRMNTNTHE